MSETLDHISDYPRYHAGRNPDRLAVVHESEELTYAQLSDRVDTMARALLAVGIAPGDRVATLATPRPHALIAYLATASIGGIWLGLNPAYTTTELAYVVGDARPVLTLYSLPEWANDAKQALNTALAESGLDPARSTSDPDLLAGADLVSPSSLAAARARVRAEDPALIVYTSGSTGQPKGALIRHSGLVRLGVIESGIWEIPDLRLLVNLPINHIGCIGDLVGVPLVAGGTLLLRDSFDAEQVLVDLETHQLTALFQVPTQLQRVAALPDFRTADIGSLRLVGWGGSPLPLDTIHRYRERGCRLVSTYGLTEATSSVTYTDPDATDEVLLNTVGRPEPGMRVRLLGEDGSWVADGMEGEVCVRNETTMAGYLNRPEASASAHTADGWLRTGDIGYVRQDGNLVLVGRVHDVFKSGGYNVYPREIEQVLESHPNVAVAAVVPQPHPDFHEVGAAFVELVPGARIEPGALRAHARERLAGYKVPKSITIQPELPLLPVGKIDRARLRAQAKGEHSTDAGSSS